MANLSLHNICNPHYQRLQERFGEDLNPWPPPWYRRCSNDQLNYRTMLHYIPHSAWITFPVSISFRILYINQSATVCKGTIAVMLFKDLTPTSPRCLDLLVTALTFQSCSPFKYPYLLRGDHFGIHILHMLFLLPLSLPQKGASNPTIYICFRLCYSHQV